MRWSFAQMCSAISLIFPSIASYRNCLFWARSEHANMPKTIQSPAKCEVLAVIGFLYDQGCKAAETYRLMSNVYGETFTSDEKCGNGSENLKRGVQTFMMQAVREGLECQPIILFSEWIRRFEKIAGSKFLYWVIRFPKFHGQLSIPPHFTFGGSLYCFRHAYGLTTRSKLTSAMCRDRRTY